MELCSRNAEIYNLSMQAQIQKIKSKKVLPRRNALRKVKKIDGYQGVEISNLFRVGRCKGSPQQIEGAVGPSGSGSLEGDSRTYECIGDFMWSDLTTGAKISTCLANGQFRLIIETCKSI